MGGFDNILARSRDSKWSPRLFGHRGFLGILLAASLSATPALAETPVVPTADPLPQHAVSTSPSPPAAPAELVAGSNPHPTDVAPDLPALTRAATKKRIEAMSPVRWLAHYGNVSIGQRE